MKYIYIRLFIALTLAPSAAAETLKSDASVILFEKDQSSYLQDLTEKWLTPHQVIAELVDIKKPYHAQIRNLSWSGVAQIIWSKPPGINTWSFDGTGAEMLISADALEIHDTVVVTTGGSGLTVHVDAVCQNLQLNLPGTWKMHGEIAPQWNQNVLKSPLQIFELQMGAGAPKVTLGACQGPSGVDVVLNRVATDYFNQPGQIQSLLASEIQRFINLQLVKVQSDLFKPVTFQASGVSVSFQPLAVNNLASGTWIVDGSLLLQSEKGSGHREIVKDYGIANLVDVRASGVAISKNLIPELIAYLSRAGKLRSDFSSSDVPAFQKFLNNRFEQFFVWMDLLSFPTNSVFDMSVSVSTTPVLTGMNNLFPGISAVVSSSISALMSAPVGGQKIPYVQFDSTQNADVNFTVQAKEGALQFDYSVEDVNANYKFRSEFFRIRRPTFGINMQPITSALQSSLSQQTWAYSLPESVSPLEGYHFDFKDLIFGKKTFRIEMNVLKNQKK